MKVTVTDHWPVGPFAPLLCRVWQQNAQLMQRSWVVAIGMMVETLNNFMVAGKRLDLMKRTDVASDYSSFNEKNLG